MVRVIATLCILFTTIPSNAAHVHNSVNETDRHVSELSNNNLYYIRRIFNEFGDGESISMEGFLRMMEMVKFKHINNTADKNFRARNGTSAFHNHVAKQENKEMEIKCLRGPELFSSNNESISSITADIFNDFCPVVLYSFVARSEYEHQHGCIYVPSVFTKSATNDERVITWEVWLCALASVIVVSLCGLLGVVVIPFMEHTFYQQMLQFLVALAVGTLCGDALLHLLPHALAGQHEDSEHGHHSNDMVLKGLVALSGIVFFFFTEKLLTIIAEHRKRKQKRREQVPPTVRVMHDGEGISASSVGEKLCKHKYSSSPYCYDEITEMTEAHRSKRADHRLKNNRDLNLNQNNHFTTYKDDDDDVEEDEEEEEEIVDHQTKVTHYSGDLAQRASTSRSSNEAVHKDDQLANQNKEDESYIVIIREHKNAHHGHSHTHGHVHSPPTTMSSVVWMVVMGDGLHNFTDGVAIGAAFAANLGGGFSTAIAVFCHELPHELGDFAVLLKAGMSPRQAVFYNLLSSILCLLGMVIGLVVGQNGSATSWVFALAAGLFLYIGLVDMIPELTSGHSNEGGSLCQCLLQFLGLMVGAAIMLMIALYEHDIKTVFRT